MIPNFKMGYYHQKEYLERSCNIQMGEKLSRKSLRESMEGFEYSSLLASKTYSILSYVVGGFVGSKSQMNNNKHNLSYDLSAAIFNLLNPCKYEREKSLRKSNECFYNAGSKLSSDSYSKYIVKSSQKGKMINPGLQWLQNCVFSFNELCYDSDQTKGDAFACDENEGSSNGKSTIDKVTECVDKSLNVTDRASVCECETAVKERSNHSINYLASERFRQQSECSIESTDSESFITFDASEQDEDEENKAEETWKLENLNADSEDDYDDDEEEEEEEEDDDDDDDDDDDESCCDEYDICSAGKELAEANDKWLRNYEGVEMRDDGDDNNDDERKVRFNDDVKVNKIVAWDYAYRAARAGPWEQMARDRVRFRERIQRLSPTISPVLRKEHRDKIYKELHS